jgi:hypothetical protein
MSKLFFLLPIICFFLAVFPVYSFEEIVFEDSDPYIFLFSDRNQAKPGDRVTFTVIFGNRGPESADSVKISFNQPLDGRSVLELVSSEPEPDRWITSEYGNIAEYLPEELDPGEKNEQKITIIIRVREAAAPQKIFPTANLQSPKREIGKRLITSDPFTLVIGNLLDLDAGEASESSSASSVSATGLIRTDRPLVLPSPQPQPEPLFDIGISLIDRSLSGLILKVSILVFAVLMLALGFIAGRHSSGK